jgi:hypothetical protein
MTPVRLCNRKNIASSRFFKILSDVVLCSDEIVFGSPGGIRIIMYNNLKSLRVFRLEYNGV